MVTGDPSCCSGADPRSRYAWYAAAPHHRSIRSQAQDGTNNTTCHSFVTQSHCCVKYVLVCIEEEHRTQKLDGIAPVQDSLQHLPYEAERGWIYLVGSILPGAGQRNRGKGWVLARSVATSKQHQHQHTTRCCSLVSVAACISYTNGHSWEHSSTRTKIACLVRGSVSTSLEEING